MFMLIILSSCTFIPPLSNSDLMIKKNKEKEKTLFSVKRLCHTVSRASERKKNLNAKRRSMAMKHYHQKD